MPRDADRPLRVTFVNAGILGMRSFSKYLREAMALEPAVESTHVTLTEDLTLDERAIRKVMCVRMWHDGWLGLRNLDLVRWRAEYQAGVQAARRLRRLRPQPDVVHFHRTPTAYASLRLMRQVPSIVSIDCTQDIVIDDARSGLERATYAPNARRDGRVFRAARAIVSTSDWAAGCLRQRYPDCRTPIEVMPTPVRLRLFDAAWIDERHARAGRGSVRVLFVGGDFVRKGGEDLLAVWRDRELSRLAELTLVTDAPVRDAGQAGVRVIRGITPYTPEWIEMWREADVFAMPTHSDAFATVYQEAAAAGLPRIGSRIAAVPETIVDGHTGLLVAPFDRPALGAALERLVACADLRRSLGRAARASVAARADPDEYRRKLTAIIRRVADGPGTRRPDLQVRRHGVSEDPPYEY
jgi:glycosyltransferase involved in cell wall biosynthesis